MSNEKTVKKTKEASALLLALSNALAGAVGGVISMSIIYPLDIVRAEMQSKAAKLAKQPQKKLTSRNGVAFERKEETEDGDFDDDEEMEEETLHLSFQETVVQIFERDGIPGFYRALSSQLGGMFLSNLVYFFWTALLKYTFFAKRDVTVVQNLIVAVCAGVICVFCTNPYWAAQCQLQLQKKNDTHQYNGVIDALIQIYRKKGVRGLYAGLTPALVLVSNPVIVFVVYERLIALLKKAYETNQLSNQTVAFCGAVAKAVATVLTYPVQVLKTQLQRKDSPFANANEAFWFAMTCIQMRNLAPLFTGMQAKLYQTVSNSAIQYMIYERLLDVIKRIFSVLFAA